MYLCQSIKHTILLCLWVYGHCFFIAHIHILLCVPTLATGFNEEDCQQEQRGTYLPEFLTQLPWLLRSDSFSTSALCIRGWKLGGKIINNRMKNWYHHILYSIINSKSVKWIGLANRNTKKVTVPYARISAGIGLIIVVNILFQDKGSFVFGSPTPTSQDQRYGYDSN